MNDYREDYNQSDGPPGDSFLWRPYIKRNWYGGHNNCISPSIIRAMRSYDRIMHKISTTLHESKCNNKNLKQRHCNCNYLNKRKEDTAKFTMLADASISSPNLTIQNSEEERDTVEKHPVKPVICQPCDVASSYSIHSHSKINISVPKFLPSALNTLVSKQTSISINTSEQNKNDSVTTLDNHISQTVNPDQPDQNIETNILPESSNQFCSCAVQEDQLVENKKSTKDININIQVKVKKKRKHRKKFAEYYKCKLKKEKSELKYIQSIPCVCKKRIPSPIPRRRCECAISEPVTIIDLPPQKKEKSIFFKIFKFCKKEKSTPKLFTIPESTSPDDTQITHGGSTEDDVSILKIQEALKNKRGSTNNVDDSYLNHYNEDDLHISHHRSYNDNKHHSRRSLNDESNRKFLEQHGATSSHNNTIEFSPSQTSTKHHSKRENSFFKDASYHDAHLQKLLRRKYLSCTESSCRIPSRHSKERRKHQNSIDSGQKSSLNHHDTTHRKHSQSRNSSSSEVTSNHHGNEHHRHLKKRDYSGHKFSNSKDIFAGLYDSLPGHNTLEVTPQYRDSEHHKHSRHRHASHQDTSKIRSDSKSIDSHSNSKHSSKSSMFKDPLEEFSNYNDSKHRRYSDEDNFRIKRGDSVELTTRRFCKGPGRQSGEEHKKAKGFFARHPELGPPESSDTLVDPDERNNNQYLQHKQISHNISGSFETHTEISPGHQNSRYHQSSDNKDNTDNLHTINSDEIKINQYLQHKQMDQKVSPGHHYSEVSPSQQNSKHQSSHSQDATENLRISPLNNEFHRGLNADAVFYKKLNTSPSENIDDLNLPPFTKSLPQDVLDDSDGKNKISHSSRPSATDKKHVALFNIPSKYNQTNRLYTKHVDSRLVYKKHKPTSKSNITNDHDANDKSKPDSSPPTIHLKKNGNDNKSRSQEMCLMDEPGLTEHFPVHTRSNNQTGKTFNNIRFLIIASSILSNSNQVSYNENLSNRLLTERYRAFNKELQTDSNLQAYYNFKDILKIFYLHKLENNSTYKSIYKELTIKQVFRADIRRNRLLIDKGRIQITYNSFLTFLVIAFHIFYLILIVYLTFYYY